MKAILLAAGLGTRLRPITDTIPKCLVPIKGKPLLGYWLDSLANTGITSILINLHHHADQVIEFIDNRSDPNDITLVFEKELLGTGGTIRENASFCKAEPVMVIHADNFCTADLKKFICAHQNRPPGTEITMMTFVSSNPTQCGIVELDPESVVVKFHEKVPNPPSNLANGAVYVFEENVTAYIVGLAKQSIDISIDVLPAFMGKIYAVASDGIHIDIGTPEALDAVSRIVSHVLQ
jgi:mannose-1-phosphate guanylyltransferase